MFAGVKALISNNRSTIFVVGGIAGVVGSGVLACKATVKAKDLKLEMDAELEAIRESGYSDENVYKRNIRQVYFTSARTFARLYGPPILLGAASIWSILYGHSILNKQNVALAGAYKLLTMNHDAYRQRIKSRFGEDIERSVNYDMQTMTIGDLDGNEQVIEYVPEDMVNIETDRSVFFDESSIYWNEDPEENKRFLMTLQELAQKKYDHDGYLFLSWIYKRLDVAETYASNVCGWVKGYTADEIDFGIFDIHSQASRRFVNGLEPVILLNFNDGGYIADKI